MELGWSFNTTSGQHQEQDACMIVNKMKQSPSWTLMPTGITTAQPIQKIPSQPLTDPYRLLRGVAGPGQSTPEAERATRHVLPLPPPRPAALTAASPRPGMVHIGTLLASLCLTVGPADQVPSVRHTDTTRRALSTRRLSLYLRAVP
jgi:hypothetical protein